MSDTIAKVPLNNISNGNSAGEKTNNIKDRVSAKEILLLLFLIIH